jgi:superfamily I DNA/RNA helicase
MGVVDLPLCATVHAMAWRMHPQEVAAQEQLLAICEDLPSPWGPAETLLNIQRLRESQVDTPLTDPLALWFEEELHKQGLKDFTDLLLGGVRNAKPRFKHILVDEYQDLTPLQLLFLSRQLTPDGTLYMVGDEHQQIYSFRGSLQSLPDTGLLRLSLPANYRSARKIVTLSSNLFEDTRINVRAIRSEEGAVKTFAFDDEQQEQELCAQWLSQAPGRALLGRTQDSVSYYKAQGLSAFTIHEAKGLEWDEVRILGCEQTNMPHILGEIDEERRIFYVAMTRAVDSLEMTFCKLRNNTSRRPSTFLLDLQFSR